MVNMQILVTCGRNSHLDEVLLACLCRGPEHQVQRIQEQIDLSMSNWTIPDVHGCSWMLRRHKDSVALEKWGPMDIYGNILIQSIVCPNRPTPGAVSLGCLKKETALYCYHLPAFGHQQFKTSPHQKLSSRPWC